MRTSDTTPLYRHTGVALLRAAVIPQTETPDWWPDLADIKACRSWLEQTWSRSDFAEAIRQASPALAHRVNAILRATETFPDKHIRRATVATARYAQRATGRPTPFGLFAGVAPVALGSAARIRWGTGHRPVARVDTQWLADIIDQLEAVPELLERLDVVFTNLAIQRGGRLEAPYGPNRVRLPYSTAVRSVRDAAGSPVRFGALADKLAETFGADWSAAADMLTELVRQGLLITCLRAPFTIIDPLSHVLAQLGEVQADTVKSVAPLLRELAAIHADLHHHNTVAATGAEQSRARTAVTSRTRAISAAGRVPLAMDLLLDCDVQLPADVPEEMQRAADVLLRLTRDPAGRKEWHGFYAAFIDRYGTGTLVPVTEALDPDAGLGYPAGYVGSVLPMPVEGALERDERLMALAWQTMADGSGELVLTEEIIASLAGDRLDERYIPPHVELAARIHATSTQALQDGDYILTVTPARSAGTLTSRFTPTATGSGLENVYRELPAAIDGALPVQLSFPPPYPHGENICRVPAYLPNVLALGEHRAADDDAGTIAVEDLALTATGGRLYLVSLSRRRVIEPLVFHALSLDKQLPPLARFLAHVPRAFSASWTHLDWGPYAHRMPYLPRVRFGRTVLSPARWYLTTNDLPADQTGTEAWRGNLGWWRHRWNCPGTVDLQEDSRTLRLSLDEPIHAAILRAHLARYGNATLTEATAGAAEYGWLDGHVHEVAVPLVKASLAAPSPLTGALPQVTNAGHGQLPGAPDARWLYAKLYTHPERMDEIIVGQLPELLAELPGDPRYWFVRYRDSRETDQLRLRIAIPGPEHLGDYLAALGEWAHRLRGEGLAGQLVLDTYHPEVGRYGTGAALEAAESVFVADSQVVAAQLRHLPAAVIHPSALAALNMVGIVWGLLGPEGGMRWLAAGPGPTGAGADRAVADQVVSLARAGTMADLPGWPGEVAEAWQGRAAALATYGRKLPAGTDVNAVVESLLHMHHNRAIGIDPDTERICRRLAWQAARARRAQKGASR